MTFLRRERDAQPAASASGSELPDHGPAPERFGVHPWLNTLGGEPLTLGGLSGRVGEGGYPRTIATTVALVAEAERASKPTPRGPTSR